MADEIDHNVTKGDAAYSDVAAANVPAHIQRACCLRISGSDDGIFMREREDIVLYSPMVVRG